MLFSTSIRSISRHDAGASSKGSSWGEGASSPGSAGTTGGGEAGPRQPDRRASPNRAVHRIGLLVVACGVLVAAKPAGEAEDAGPDFGRRLRPEIGADRAVFVEPEDTLLDIAFRERVGFDALSRLNPDIDAWLPAPGTLARLPTRMLLPEAEEEGLVLNIPEMRLFDFTSDRRPEVFAVAVGDPEVPTPVGDFVVGNKRVDPTWNVPASILEERPGLPARVAPGPDNPLGTRWMTIGNTSYGLHGTNVRWSIGRDATHGCVRLYESDVRELFDRIEEGVRLQLVYQPYKWGMRGRKLLFEAHPDLYGLVPDRLAEALAAPRELGLLGIVDVERVWREVEAVRGVPVVVGTLPREPLTSTPSS